MNIGEWIDTQLEKVGVSLPPYSGTVGIEHGRQGGE